VTGGSGSTRTFQNLANGMYLASGTDDSGNSVVVWSTDSYTWNVSNSGTGTWGINVVGSDYECWNSPVSNDRFVNILLVSKTGAEGSLLKWVLYAA
jgi:hypothetical protein